MEAISESVANSKEIAKVLKKMNKAKRRFSEEEGVIDLRTPMGDGFENFLHSGGSRPFDASHLLTNEEADRILAERAAAQKKTKK